MKCDDCESDEGVECNCPYDEDVLGIETSVVLCDICHHERCMDI